MKKFVWTDFYSEFATSLLKYAPDRTKLIEMIKEIYTNAKMKLPTLERDNNIVDIDPFTIFALFNKGITNENRYAILTQVKDLFKISADVPNDFDGIPVANNMSATFYYFNGDREENDIENLWNLFRYAIIYADQQTNESEFINAFNKVVSQKGVSWNITMGLYWIRPYTFINLDARNRKLLENNQSRFKPDIDIMKTLKRMVSAENYLILMKKTKEIMSEYNNFPELSFDAWKKSTDEHYSFFNNNNKSFNAEISKNTILYGPPGTGKTYNTVLYAVAIIESKSLADVKNENYSDVLTRYNTYKADGLIEFTTFHQSYGYEEFIEGIKPVMDNTDETASDIRYSIENGLFKAFCNKASIPVSKKANIELGLNKNPTVWKVSLCSTGDNQVRTECHENGHIRIGWDEYGGDITEETDFSEFGGRNVLNAFISQMKIGDIVFSCYSSSTIDAIGIVTGEYEWCDEKYDYYNRKRNVNWIVKGINENILDINNGNPMTLASVYKLNRIALSDVMAIIEKHLPQAVEEKKNHVFIIDEINRGNISKIFGELITLIESPKRLGQEEGMKIRLPYSRQLFGVPDNVYIIGTMNTADRSIAAIDTALRRRFRFKEMMPDLNVLNSINIEDISISDMLTRINKRISVLYDREHTIGHAYFIPLKDNPTIEQLAEIFENAIIPLLQEYFYEDYEKIRLILGDNKKNNKEEQFIIAIKNDYNDLFGNSDVGFDDSVTYEINHAAFENIEAYKQI